MRHIYKHPGQPGPDQPLPPTHPWAHMRPFSSLNSDLLLLSSSFPVCYICLPSFPLESGVQEADSKPVSPKGDQNEEGLRALSLGMPTAEAAEEGRLTPVTPLHPG